MPWTAGPPGLWLALSWKPSWASSGPGGRPPRSRLRQGGVHCLRMAFEERLLGGASGGTREGGQKAAGPRFLGGFRDVGPEGDTCGKDFVGV